MVRIGIGTGTVPCNSWSRSWNRNFSKVAIGTVKIVTVPHTDTQLKVMGNEKKGGGVKVVSIERS